MKKRETYWRFNLDNKILLYIYFSIYFVSVRFVQPYGTRRLKDNPGRGSVTSVAFSEEYAPKSSNKLPSISSNQQKSDSLQLVDSLDNPDTDRTQVIQQGQSELTKGVTENQKDEKPVKGVPKDQKSEYQSLPQSQSESDEEGEVTPTNEDSSVRVHHPPEIEHRIEGPTSPVKGKQPEKPASSFYNTGWVCYFLVVSSFDMQT